MKFNYFFLVLTLLSQSPIYANDASFTGDGATVYTTQENRIHMIRETIRIKENPTKENQRRWVAECVFEFKNLTSQPLSITMGFPNWYPFGDNVGSGLAVQ